MGHLMSDIAARFYRRKRLGRLFDLGRLLTIRQDLGGYYSTEAINRERRLFDEIR